MGTRALVRLLLASDRAVSSEVNSDAVKASFKDGVVEVHLPKTEAAKRKPMKVAIE